MEEKKVSEKTIAKHKRVIDVWLSNGENGTQAYMEIYPNSEYESADKSFRRLTENARIQEYIAEKRKELSEKTEITRESLINDLERAKEMSLVPNNSGQPNTQAYIKAVEAQAKMLGLNEPDKLDVTTGGDPIKPPPLRFVESSQKGAQESNESNEKDRK